MNFLHILLKCHQRKLISSCRNGQYYFESLQPPKILKLRFKGFPLMASEFGSGSGSWKRPKYVDLDAPNPSSEDPWDTRLYPTSSNPSIASSGSKNSKKVKNPNWPRKEYGDTTRKYVLQYYKVPLL